MLLIRGLTLNLGGLTHCPVQLQTSWAPVATHDNQHGSVNNSRVCKSGQKIRLAVACGIVGRLCHKRCDSECEACYRKPSNALDHLVNSFCDTSVARYVPRTKHQASFVWHKQNGWSRSSSSMIETSSITASRNSTVSVRVGLIKKRSGRDKTASSCLPILRYSPRKGNRPLLPESGRRLGLTLVP